MGMSCLLFVYGVTLFHSNALATPVVFHPIKLIVPSWSRPSSKITKRFSKTMNEQRNKVNMRELDLEAKSSATKQFINMLQRPGQLEKVEQYKRTLVRKKASVEALLKSGMQSQLDGARNGINKLPICLQNTKDVEARWKLMINMFPEVSNLSSKLNEVRDENMRYSQYVTARENLKHIFTVPESIKKSKQWIDDGKLLHTHQCLRDLENSRDDLLFELHKLPNQSVFDKNMLKDSFKDVETLSNSLEKQIRIILSRTLNTVRKEPTVIVAALRIIEREEKADEQALKHEKQTGFKSPGRPKQWKKMAFEVLEKAVATRIEGTQVDEREDNKLWLVRYLELTRQLILEDLRVVKSLCVPCFPPEYHIVDAYVRMYHNCLSRHLQDIIQNGLEGNEYVSLLSWTLNTYNSEELMGHPDLKIHTECLKPLLPDTVLNSLLEQYLKNMEKNYTEWLQNTLSSEKQEWKSTSEPLTETELRSATPVIIFQMIDQNLQVTETISQSLTCKALILSIEQMIKYGEIYREAIIEYKNKHFEDRSQVPFFTHYMIIIVNNCLEIIDLGVQLQKQYWNQNLTPELSDVLKRLNNTFISLRNDSCGYLLEELILDIGKQFDDLFTTRWFDVSIPIDTICATLDDYFQDYNRLSEVNLRFIINEAKTSVVKRYLIAMLSKKISFKTYEECQKAANQITREANQLKKVFTSIAPNIKDDDDLLDTIILFSEVLKCEDDMISFDLHRIVDKYSDVTEDHLLRLLYLRGDLPKSDLKEKVTFVTKTSKPSISPRNNIFKQLVFPKLLSNLGL